MTKQLRGGDGELGERLEELAGLLRPIRLAAEDDRGSAYAVKLRLIDAGRRYALVAERASGVDQELPNLHDRGVRGAQMLVTAIVNRPHALGYRLVLERDRGQTCVGLG